MSPMRKSIIVSSVLHGVVIVAAVTGLPSLLSSPPVPEVPIVIEMVDVSAMTNLPTARKRVAQPKAKPKPKPQPPQAKKAPPPPPPPPAPPEEKVAAVAPPDAQPKKEKVKPKETEEAPPKPATPAPLVKAKPKKKPQPPDPFASVLKNVEKLKNQPLPEKQEEEKKEPEKKPDEDDFEQQIAKALSRRPIEHNPERKISISERDNLIGLIKSQLEPCWNLPAGAKDVENLVVEIKVTVNQNGEVRSADIQGSSRMFTDPFFRAVAESALRAVRNPRCSPLKLPVEHYDIWKDLTISFDPRAMITG